MIGTLLEDIAAGMDFATVSKRFASRMPPLQYQRPQALPLAGNIAEAEKLVEKMGIAPSLERRFARLKKSKLFGVRPLNPIKNSGGGVFSHLTPKGAAPAVGLNLPSKTMTWQIKSVAKLSAGRRSRSGFTPQPGTRTTRLS